MQNKENNLQKIDWERIAYDPRFQTLYREKTRFLWRLMCFALLFFFCLPISTAYFQDLLNVKVWGVINVGLLFALSQFVVAWAIAMIYAKRANQIFDQKAQAIISSIH